MKWLIGLAAASVLGACAVPDPQPRRLEGEQLTRLYSAIEAIYLQEEKFRTDYDPADAPYDEATLTRNFVHVAQRSETQTVDDTIIVAGESIPLSRWQRPIRLWTTGATTEDDAHLTALSQRVTRLTGLSVNPAQDAEDANVYILIADAAERQELVMLLDALGRTEEAPLVAAWPDLAEYPCIARVFIDPEQHTLEWAMIFVKAELSGQFRKSCLTEEFIQSLGLFNDGPDIRPSIFNDDAEFIELTRHDEYLLQILYDNRLRPGMLSGEAEPIVREIAAELLANDET